MWSRRNTSRKPVQIKTAQNLIKYFRTYLPLPKLTPNLERIINMKILKLDPEDYDIREIIKLDLAIEEMCLPYDSSVGLRYLFDFSGFTLRHLTRINPILLAKHITLIEVSILCTLLLEFICDFRKPTRLECSDWSWLIFQHLRAKSWR
jgi:hypothetical protein